MPVTIPVAKHGAREYHSGWKGSSSRDVLNKVIGRNAWEIRGLIESSLSDARVASSQISPCNNGLVRAAFLAYIDHHHLIIRPEDIWFAVLGQFSYYVNEHAEELRHSFVSRKGKKGLILKQEFPGGDIDYGSMCKNMTDLIDQNIVDPELRSWILPSFTTTTNTDQVVASVLMMGMMQKYFEYIFNPVTCGIPTITLLGEKSDYEDILRRIEKLTEYGKEPTRFAELLRPILKYCIATFSCSAASPDAAVVDFWSRIVHYSSGSGFDSLSGWITAFSFWDEDGKCMAYEYFWDNKLTPTTEPGHLPPAEEMIRMYHEVDPDEVPAGFVTVPVTLIINNDPPIDTKLLAGSVGFEVTTARQRFQPSSLTPGSEGMTLISLANEDKKSSTKATSFLSSLRRKVLSSCSGGKNTSSGAARNSGPIPSPEVVQGPQTSIQNQPGESAEDTQLNTLQPVSAWWMYEKVVDVKSIMTGQEFLHKKKTEEWTGSSTMHISSSGVASVEHDN